MHRRSAASAASSTSKVAASRERRAKRANKMGGGIRNGNGQLPLHSKHKSDQSEGAGQRIILLIGGTIIICVLGLWGGALLHVTTSSDGSSSGTKLGRAKDALKRMRNGKSNYQSEPAVPVNAADTSDGSPYMADALDKNPYLGWQPPSNPSPLGSSFSVRKCFKAGPKSDGSDQPAGCYENPAELGIAPKAATDWIPDVTMIRKMMMYGKDKEGNPFPPQLPNEFCEDIEGRGGKTGDINKECVRESLIHTTGPLNSTTVTISPSNHYGVENGNANSIEVPAPKIMCLVYTMADAHANRIRAMRETWAGGCDGFLAFSTESDPRLPAISLDHEGPEAYENVSTRYATIVSS